MKAALALLVGTLLTACGQKGPLYLPEPTGEVVTRPAPAAEPAPETPPPDKKDEEKKTEPRE